MPTKKRKKKPEPNPKPINERISDLESRVQILAKDIHHVDKWAFDHVDAGLRRIGDGLDSKFKTMAEVPHNHGVHIAAILKDVDEQKAKLQSVDEHVQALHSKYDVLSKLSIGHETMHVFRENILSQVKGLVDDIRNTVKNISDDVLDLRSKYESLTYDKNLVNESLGELDVGMIDLRAKYDLIATKGAHQGGDLHVFRNQVLSQVKAVVEDVKNDFGLYRGQHTEMIVEYRNLRELVHRHIEAKSSPGAPSHPGVPESIRVEPKIDPLASAQQAYNTAVDAHNRIDAMGKAINSLSEEVHCLKLGKLGEQAKPAEHDDAPWGMKDVPVGQVVIRHPSSGRTGHITQWDLESDSIYVSGVGRFYVQHFGTLEFSPLGGSDWLHCTKANLKKAFKS